MSSSYYLRFWDPTSGEEAGREAGGVGDVAVAADLAGEAYRRAGVCFLPGLALWRGVDEPGDSLGLGIAPDGWAVVHTDHQFFQVVTRGSRALDGVRRAVQFDDFLEIPSACFIGRGLALEAVAYWMATGGLLPRAGFSDDLFTS